MGASGIWHPQVRLLKPARALVLYPSSPLLKSAVAMDPRTSCLESLSPSPSVPDICLGSLTILWKTQYMDMTAPSAPNKTASEFALKEPTFFFQNENCISEPSHRFQASRPVLGKARFIFRCGYCLWMLLACGHTDVLEASPLLRSVSSRLRHCISYYAVPSSCPVGPRWVQE